MILEVILNDKELISLYTKGSSRKLKLPSQIIEKFLATVQKIESATTIQDLLSDNGLHFEKLKGRGNGYSMRLSGKYRLEFEIVWIDQKQIVGKFFLITISNHYS